MKSILHSTVNVLMVVLEQVQTKGCLAVYN